MGPAAQGAPAGGMQLVAVNTLASGVGTYTRQARTKWLRVSLVGGGGGGGNGGQGTGGPSYIAGGFGKAGQSAESLSVWMPATAGMSFAYSIGAAGLGADGTPGTAGGSTSFGAYTALGGEGGLSGGNTGSPSFEFLPSGGRIPGLGSAGVGGRGGNPRTDGSYTGTGGFAGGGGRIVVEEWA